ACERRLLCGRDRLPQDPGEAARAAAGRGRLRGGARAALGAGRARPRRGHACRDRGLDPRRDPGLARGPRRRAAARAQRADPRRGPIIPAMSWLSDLVEERGAEALDLHAQAINPQFVRLLRTIGFDRRWARAQGQYLWDADGNRYLDLLGGFGMFNVGRNNPRVREALVEALELERPGSVQLGVDVLPALLAEELLRRAPASVDKVLFTSSGAESVEAALKLGRAATGRSRVLSAEHGFHGLTLGALSATTASEFTSRFGPLLPGFEQVPWDDLSALEAKLRSEDVALFIVEPVQGKGVNIPAPGYLDGAQELCRRFGTLFCVDEVQTGFGRTGRMFALEHWGLEPDLVTVAKSLSGGYVPVGALLMSSE